MTNKLPKYNDVSNYLFVAQLEMSASQMHGWLVGLFSAHVIKADERSARLWARESLGLNPGVDTYCVSIFEELYLATYPNLIDSEFAFTLLLPDEDEDIEQKALELGHWCKGFLAGLGMADFPLDDFISEDYTESIRLLKDIVELDYDTIRFSKDDEAAFCEAVGYVRLSVLTIFMEIQNLQRGTQGAVKYLH